MTNACLYPTMYYRFKIVVFKIPFSERSKYSPMTFDQEKLLSGGEQKNQLKQDTYCNDIDLVISTSTQVPTWFHQPLFFKSMS